MRTVRVVWGGASGPTPMAAYDAALAEAGIHEYNLVTVSSVLPEGVSVAVDGVAPDLGPVGSRLTVVLSRDTVALEAERPAVAGLGWARSPDDGPGVVYEAGGLGADAVRRRIAAGLEHGADLRGWSAEDHEIVVRATDAAPEAYTTQVVCAAYGTSEPIFDG